MTALTVRCLPSLAIPENSWSGTWESNPVSLRSERSGLPSSSFPKLEPQHLAGPSGFEPESQPSEGWALSCWTMDRLKLGWPEEIESSWTVPQTAAYPLGHGHTCCQRHRSIATASLTNLVEEEGIEPSSAGCRPAVLPLDDSPNVIWSQRG